MLCSRDDGIIITRAILDTTVFIKQCVLPGDGGSEFRKFIGIVAICWL